MDAVVRHRRYHIVFVLHYNQLLEEQTLKLSPLFAVLYLLAIFLVLVVLHAYGATTAKHSNTLGTISYVYNPYIYNAGSIADVRNVDGNLSLRFLPLGTYSLYDENILLCGLPVDKFTGVHEPFLLTYHRQASRIVQGVGCHELVRVDSLSTERLK